MPTPHCKHCGYPLTALSEPRCPECGNAFDLRDLSTFENRYPRDWHDRIVDLLVVVSLVVIVLSLVEVWFMFKSDPGR